MKSPREREFFPLSPSNFRDWEREDESANARYKGVVLQQNGNWGAQIYVNHTRIWLGTFKSERAAARAYDSAAIKLHRGDCHRNFTWNESTIREPMFQDYFTTENILQMIKDGSYEPRFNDFVRAFHFSNGGCGGGAATPALAAPPVLIEGFTCTEMFQKELTRSDVGKLNRLVIHKRHATQYLPDVINKKDDELMLEFLDRTNRSWMFRYCHWKSSQSYVFTKGWNKFVKEMNLTDRDTVVFYRCQEIECELQSRPFCMIDIIRNTHASIDGQAADNHEEDAEGVENSAVSMDEEVVKSEPLMEEDYSGEEKKVMKLFGAWIR